MASKLFSRIASKFIGKKTAICVPVSIAPVETPHTEPAPVALAEPQSSFHNDTVTPLTRQERETSFNPVLLKVGNITNHLSPGATLTGDLVLKDGGIRVKCHIEGTVTQDSNDLLIVDQEAVINGAVKAKYLLVLGTVNGDLTADRIVVGASARINGDISYQRSFGSVTGARIRGRIAEVEQSATIHHMPIPTPVPHDINGSTGFSVPTPPPAMPNDDDEDVYAAHSRRKVFSFPVNHREDDHDNAMPEVRYAIR